MATWQVQTAKQRFSEVLRSAESGEPQTITRHGVEVAVIVDAATYRREHEGTKVSFKKLLTGEPFWGDELELPKRKLDRKRDTGLEDP